MTRWCSVRGRGRTALITGAALAACVSLTSSVHAGVVGFFNASSTSSSLNNVNASFPAAFSFTTGTSSSLTQFKLLTQGNASSTDVTINLYQHTGALQGGFSTTSTALATWTFTGAITSAGLQTNTFDLTTNLTSGSADVAAGTQYVLTWGPSNVVGVLNDGSGSRLGTEGWATFGGLSVSPEVDTGAYYNNGGSNWNNAAFNWELTFGSAAAVPGAGVAGLSVVGLAGLRRRRR